MNGWECESPRATESTRDKHAGPPALHYKEPWRQHCLLLLHPVGTRPCPFCTFNDSRVAGGVLYCHRQLPLEFEKPSFLNQMTEKWCARLTPIYLKFLEMLSVWCFQTRRWGHGDNFTNRCCHFSSIKKNAWQVPTTPVVHRHDPDGLPLKLLHVYTNESNKFM